MARVDVTVRGAGIFGLATAWALVKRGAAVRVVDPGGPGAGASGGIVGALAPHVPENWNAKKAFQLESLLMAPRFWSEVADQGGADPGYGQTGRLQPIADDRAMSLAQQREVSARALWSDHATWSVRPASEFGAWSPPSPTGYVIHDTLSARMHPRRATMALAKALAHKGVEITDTAPDEGSVLWATGAAGLADLSTELGEPIGNAVKGQAALLQYDARAQPQLFVESLHIVPHADGTTAIGSTSERDWQTPTDTDTQLDGLIDTVRQKIPALAQAPLIRRWAGLRPRARSRAPMLGHYPGRPGHFIANGGFKIGFGMAPLVAVRMADLILDGQAEIPPDFHPDASMKQKTKGAA